MSAVEELNTLLLSLSALKPPGANKSKITAITNLCIANANQCPQILQTIRDRFNTSPNTHKLGVLYVLDAVVRQWADKARLNKEDATTAGSDVSKAPNSIGVVIATQLLPPMMHDLIQNAPEDQKERIGKMIEIWERGNTFPQQLLADFKQRLGARKTLPSFQEPPRETKQGSDVFVSAAAPLATGTPTGATSDPTAQPQAAPVASAAPSGTVSLLASLANVGKQQTATPTQNVQYQNSAQYVTPTQPQQQNVGPALTAPPMPSYVPQPNGQGNAAPASAAAPAPAVPVNPLMPQAFQSMPGGNEAFMQFIGSLVQQGWSPEQIAQVIAAMSGNAQGLPGVPGMPAATQPPQAAPAQNGFAQMAPNGHVQAAPDYRSREDPRDFDRSRDRSRSPGSKHRRSPPVNRRESPTYGAYDPYIPPGAPDGPGGGPGSANGQPSSEHGGNRRGGRKNRRNRDKHRNSPAVQQQQQQQQQSQQQRSTSASTNTNSRPKYIQHDPNLPRGNIKVLSRTLFVGGVSASEQELRQIFSRFGEVQTCIVNPEKHHAFVKMANRTDSVQAKLGMEKEKNPQVLNKARQTRWGVGFGPRECSDYSTGISVIPIDRLTEADRKWVVTSEYGGTGGRALETGLVIEEPDIEIGTGVSSKGMFLSSHLEIMGKPFNNAKGKAMSRRVGPEPTGKHGHFHGRRNNHGGGGGHHGGGFDPNAPRFRKPDPRPGGPQGGEPRPEPHTIGVPPAVPGFGFQLPGM
ncbi:hypothetical protein SLS55_006169 [Diplodia seriata]|uniref:Rpb7-binding protein seb1 n=1 Tax=Diplodia seriata TaxID=420778 RepID=A0ABR3CGX1_9PEZI